MTASTGRSRRIETEYDDGAEIWRAWFHPETSPHVGAGETEQAAIEDLLRQVEEVPE